MTENLRDPNATKRVMDEIFGKPSKRNPASAVDDGEGDWRVKLNVAMLSLAGSQSATTSWNEDQWREYLQGQGLTANNIVDALDTIASWGVTDDALEVDED